MLFLSEQEMWQSVTLEDIMDAIEDAYAIHKSGNYKMPDRFIAQRDKNMLLYMPCFLDSVIGTKMLSEFPDNPSLGIPYLNGLMILNDAKTGLPKAIMNGSALTAMRTGAVGGVALRYLAPEDAASVGLVGCGIQGLHQLLYACEVRPITNIYLYDAYVNALFQRNFQIAALFAGIWKLGVRIFDEFPDCIRQFAPLRTPGADGNKAFTTKQLFIIRVDRIDRLGGGDQDAAVLSQFTGIRAGMNQDGVFSKRCQTRR